MKIIKTISFIGIMSFFISFPLSVEARDCSNPEGFHQKMMCKVSGGLSIDADAKKDKKAKKEKKKKEIKKANEDYDSLADLLKALKKKKN